MAWPELLLDVELLFDVEALVLRLVLALPDGVVDVLVPAEGAVVVVVVFCASLSAAVPSRKAPDRAA